LDGVVPSIWMNGQCASRRITFGVILVDGQMDVEAVDAQVIDPLKL
jgi:hypothetical protein